MPTIDVTPLLHLSLSLTAPSVATPPLPGRPVEGAASGATGTGATGAGGGGSNTFLFMTLGVLVLMFLMMSMTSKKEKRKREALLGSLKKHDRVQTIGGVIGSVVEVKPDVVVLKVDESSNIRMTFARSAIQSILKEAPSTPA
jgi:preprotein translocase subunit YajC